MTPDEIALTSPATLTDQFHISWSAGMARITFLESMQGQNPVARHAVAMATVQLAALRDALDDVINRIEQPKGNLADQISDVTPTKSALMDALADGRIEAA